MELGNLPSVAAARITPDLSTSGTDVVNASWFCIRCSHSRTPIPPRDYASMVYDAADGYVVLFGGDEDSGEVNDTWIYNAGSWTELALGIAPSPRMGAAMAYDSADGYVVLFGGWNSFNVLGDTWIFKGGAWTQLAPPVSPPPREFASMTYDTADGYVLLFGGGGQGTNVTLSDTWRYKAGAWEQLSPATSPPSRFGAAMAYDPVDRYVVLFGGANSSVYGDSWTFNGATWTRLSPPVGPASRWGTGLAYDAEEGGLVLFGGFDRLGAFGDTWLFKAGLWGPLAPMTSPSARGALAMTTDSADGYVLLVGGYLTSTNSYVGDPWGFGAPLRVILSANPSSIEPGQSVTFAAAASGGAPPYVYSWTDLPQGCNATYTPDLTCTPTTTGTFAVSVNVNDTAWIVNGSQLSFGVMAPSAVPAWLVFVGVVAVVVVGGAIVILWKVRRRRGVPPNQR